MNNKIAELSVLAVASKYGLLKQNQQGEPTKTKKQIKAREATKRQRKARKKHAYKSIFRDKAKVVKKKSDFFAWCKRQQQSAKILYNIYTGRYELASIDEAHNGDGKDWQEFYESTIKKAKQDIIDSSCLNRLSVHNVHNRLSVENVEKFIDNELNKYEANPKR